ncbi:MFS transporter [Limnochorda pilosa]|uniref:MFS transporter n=1 Tax=Limnochorda pilosa TaxID=1555112 RepID=UPI0026F12B3A|nr:MFS transporter [Limnochorda pilosa]
MILAAACLTLMGAFLTQSALSPVLPWLEASWGVSHAQAGLLFSAYQAGYILSSALFLVGLDRRQARGEPAHHLLWQAAGLAALAGTAFPLLARGLASGVLLRFLAGVGLGGVYMPGVNLLARMVPSTRRGRFVGTYVASSILAQGLSLAVTGVLAARWGWRAGYLAMGVASWVGPVAGLFWARGSSLVPPRPGGEERAAAARPGPEPARAPGLLEPPPRRLSPWRPGLGVLAAALAYAGHTWELYGQRAWLTPYLAEGLAGEGLGAAVTQAGWLAGTTTLLGAVTTGLGGALSDRWGRPLTAAALLLASSTTTLLLGWIGGWPPPLVWGLLLVSGLTLTADSPIFSIMVTELAPPDGVGRAQAWQTVLGYLSGGISPWVLGLVADRWGWRLAWAAGAAGPWVAMGALAFYALRMRQQAARTVTAP